MFQVAASGKSIETASGPQALLNDSQPLTKLDVTNGVSFQTLNILFNHEPPQPPNSSPWYTTTLLYQFKHGYTYTPADWMMWQNSSPTTPGNPGVGSSATTFYPFGDDTAGYDAKQAIAGTITSNPGTLMAQTVYNNSGSIVTTTDALIYATVDSTYMYIYCMKRTQATIGGSVIPLYLIGETINLRTYVFTEPSTTSSY